MSHQRLPKDGYQLQPGMTYLVSEGSLIEINEQLDWKASPDFLTCLKPKRDESFTVTWTKKPGEQNFIPTSKLEDPAQLETFYFFHQGKRVVISFDVASAYERTRSILAARAQVSTRFVPTKKKNPAKNLKEFTEEFKNLLKELDV